MIEVIVMVDEEKPDIKAAFERTKPKSEPSSKPVKQPSPEKSRKQVSVMDIFGGGAIHRVESKTSGSASNKRKAVRLHGVFTLPGT